MHSNSNTNWTCAVAVLFAAICTLGMSQSTAIAAEDAKPKQATATANRTAMLATWKSRQKRIRSIQVEWKEARTDFKGAYFEVTTRKYWPGSDTSYEGVSELLLDENKSRYSYNGKGWSSVGGKPMHLVRRDYVIASDGKTCKAMTAASDKDAYPSATIRKDALNFYLATMHVAPLSWYARPTERSLAGWSSNELQITTDVGLINGLRCIIARTPAKRGARWNFWISPERDYTIQRATQSDNSGFRKQFDISYRKSKRGEWVPKGWVYTKLKPRGKQYQTQMDATVRTIRINPRLSADRFRIEFPPGTWVTDLRGGNLFRGTEKQYIVREKGRNRPILPSEIGRTYKDLRDSEPGEAPANGFERWFYVAAVIALALAAAGVLYRRRRR